MDRSEEITGHRRPGLHRILFEISLPFLCEITHEPVNGTWLLLTYNPLRSNFNSSLLIDLMRRSRLAVIEQCCPQLYFYFFTQPVLEQQAGCGAGGVGERKGKEDLQTLLTSLTEAGGRDKFYLFVSEPPASDLTAMLHQDFFCVCSIVRSKQSVLYPVFGNRARCTTWQPLHCFYCPLLSSQPAEY